MCTTQGLVSLGLGMLERMSIRLADVAIATNESYRSIDIQRNGIDPSRIFVVRNGPDLRRVKLVEPDQSLKTNGQTILGYVGAMNPQDGVDYLLRALRCLARDLGRSDFYCLLMLHWGLGDDVSRSLTPAAEIRRGDAPVDRGRHRHHAEDRSCVVLQIHGYMNA